MTYSLPKLSLTTEESARYSAIYNECSTYLEENVVRFIIGAKDMGEWDSFINEFVKIGINEAIAVQQGALDRFIAR